MHLLHTWKKKDAPYLVVELETEYAKLYGAQQDFQCAICGKVRKERAWHNLPSGLRSVKKRWFLKHEVGEGEVKFDSGTGIFVLPPIPSTPDEATKETHE